MSSLSKRAGMQGMSRDVAEKHRLQGAVPAEPCFEPAKTQRVVIVLGALLVLSVVYSSRLDIASAVSLGWAQNRHSLSQVQAVARPVTKELLLTGVLAPKEEHTVTAPFEGHVLEKHVSLGQRVSASDVLARISTRDVEIQLREAEAALIKARQQLVNLQDWQSSPEVNNARRDLEQSQRRLETLSRRVEQSKRLLDIGIIPASEYDGELQQLEDQRLDVASAREALASTLQRGDATERQIAALELENAEIKAKRLRETIAEATIASPIDGIIVAAKPPAGGNSADVSFNIGDKVLEGQPLFSIADTENLIVRSEIDEIDIDSVDLGQAATVVSDSLPGLRMIGHLTKIAYQASKDRPGSGAFPSFDIELTLDAIPPEQRRRLRLGVTVELAMDIYHNANAIVVPFDAIEDGADGPFARVVKDGGALEMRPVVLGKSFVDGVEVISGLQAGDVLAIAEAAQDAKDEPL